MRTVVCCELVISCSFGCGSLGFLMLHHLHRGKLLLAHSLLHRIHGPLHFLMLLVLTATHLPAELALLLFLQPVDATLFRTQCRGTITVTLGMRTVVCCELVISCSFGCGSLGFLML